MQRSICPEHELFLRYRHVRLVSAASMAAAQSQKRFENVKAAGPGLYYHDGAHAGSILLDWHFRQAEKKLFSCLQALDNLDLAGEDEPPTASSTSGTSSRSDERCDATHT